ncbi:hypothetical protein [Arthrobacter sp. H14]|uniref:hypothetical protein n=1 Tax=Arthrobacter sp. H14 TaxID=1312959 RepID=UPI000479538B
MVTQAEHDAIAGILTTTSPNQPVPTDNGGVEVGVEVPKAAAPDPETEEPTPETDGAPAGSGRRLLRELHRRPRGGSRLYTVVTPATDSEGDGIGCE